MADTVQFYLEQMVPELEDLENKNLFSKVCVVLLLVCEGFCKTIRTMLIALKFFFSDRNQGNRQEEDQLWICIEKTYKQKSWLSSIHWIWNELGSSSQEAQVTFRYGCLLLADRFARSDTNSNTRIQACEAVSFGLRWNQKNLFRIWASFAKI